MTTAHAHEIDPKADPRTFARIPVRLLVVDERKQREVDLEKVARMAHSFDWARFEAITVSRRLDDLFDVIEGSHRTLTGREYGGDNLELPCMILPEEVEDKEQSQIALDIVQGRRTHSAYEQWRLRYNAGHPHEIYATAILDMHGIRLGKAPSAATIGAIATVRRIVHGGGFTPEFGAQLLDQTIKVVMDAFPTYDHESNVSRWDRHMLLAVSGVLLKFPDADRKRLATKLRIRPASQWLSIGRNRANTNPEVAIQANILTEYNRNLRKGKLQ